MGKTGRPGFYAVRRGRTVGVYKTWDECKANVDSYGGARYKKFDSSAEAWKFINSSDTPKQSAASSNRTYSQGSSGTYSQGSSSSYRRGRYGGGATSSRSYSSNYSHGNYSSNQEYTAPVASSSSYATAPTYSAPKRQYSDYTATTASKKRRAEPQQQNDRVAVYTDGACSFNGQRGAKAGCGVYWGPKHPNNISQRLKGRQTNQRAEITACTLALETARSKGIPKVTLNTDSQYTINCINSWMPKWKENGWKTTMQKDVSNKKDLMRLDEMCREVDVQWEYVPGHSNVKGNEAADKLATGGAAMPYTYRTKKSCKQDYDDFYDDDSDDDYY